MMETMIPPQVEMRLQTKNKKNKKKRPKKPTKKAKKKQKKLEKNERRDNVTILLPHLCFKVAP